MDSATKYSHIKSVILKVTLLSLLIIIFFPLPQLTEAAENTVNAGDEHSLFERISRRNVIDP